MFVGCLTSQQHASVSQRRRENKIQEKLERERERVKKSMIGSERVSDRG